MTSALSVRTIILAALGASLFGGFLMFNSSEGPTPPPPQEPFLNEQFRLFQAASDPTSSLAATHGASSTPPQVPAGTLCTGSNIGNFDCYEQHYQALVANTSIEGAFADLRNRYPQSAYIRAQCHPLTHVIGRAASEKFETPGEAYEYADSFCWSGYHHGVLEGIIARIGKKNLPSYMDSICDSIKGKEYYSFDYYNCVHGLGHGVMSLTVNELPEALTYCDTLTGTWEQVSCASGAFMENVIVDGKNHFTAYLDPKRPLYPCTDAPEKYKDTCYLMQTSYMLKINGGDFKKTFEWCGEAEEKYRNTCYASLGRDASGRSTSNVEKTRATCLLGEPGNQQMYCVTGAVKDFISYFHSDTQAKELCNSFEDADLRSTCLSTAESYYRLF